MSKLLLVSSNIHPNLAAKQLENCLKIVRKSVHDYQVEIVQAGTYEIPFVINSYHRENRFDGYIALGLVLTSNREHYHHIMSHISACFTYFSLHNIAVGNAIISADSPEELASKIDNEDPCVCLYPSAFKAIDYLMRMKEKLASNGRC